MSSSEGDAWIAKGEALNAAQKAAAREPRETTSDDFSGKDLRARNHIWVKGISWFTVIFLILTVGASVALGSYVYDKVIKDNGSNEEKKIGLASPILSAVALAIIVVYFFYILWYLVPKIKAEDTFLTDATRIATVPISSKDLRESFGNYIDKKIGGNTRVDRDTTIRALGGYLAGNYTTTAASRRKALQNQHIPFRTNEQYDEAMSDQPSETAPIVFG